MPSKFNNPRLRAALAKLNQTHLSVSQPSQEKKVNDVLMMQLVKALESMGRIDMAKGEKGDAGYTPVKGLDYFDGKPGYTPIKGKDYVDGKNGKDGYTPKKNVDYFDGKDGKPGKDGEDASVEEMNGIAKGHLEKHEKEFNHDLIHNSTIVGPLTVDIESIKQWRIPQIQNQKLVFIDLPNIDEKLAHMQRFMRGVSSTTSARYRIRTVTQSYTLDPLDQIVHVNASAGNVVITFYPAAGNEGSHIYIKRVDNQLQNTVEFQFPNGETIDFEALYQLVNRGSGAEVYAHDSNFYFKHT